MNLKDLQAPFPNNEIDWRVGATNADKTSGIALAYLTNRAIQDRLDEVCGMENWKNEYMPAPSGGVLCGISIRVGDEWVTKWDGAENTDYEGVKGGLSDAMKRAAVQWGIGRYLYKADVQWVAIKQAGKSFVIAEPGKMVLKIDGKPVDVRPMNDPSINKGGAKKTVRPLAPLSLIAFLIAAAEKSTAGNEIIGLKESTGIAMRMGKFIKNEKERHAFLMDTFNIETSKELRACEYDALNRWLESASENIIQDECDQYVADLRAVRIE